MKKYREQIWSIIFFLLLSLLVFIVLFILISNRQEMAHELKIGGVFIDSIEDDGWSEIHYEGLSAACDKLDLPLEIVEHVDENAEATAPAVAELVSKGCNVIFLTSGGFGNNCQQILESYPDVTFYTVSTECDAFNTSTYFGRIYEMRYLSGIIAGTMTKTNILGFVGGTNTPQVDRGVNAYYLGAKSVNPDVKLKVRFIGSWSDEEAERRAAEKLIFEDGADVMTFHASHPITIDVAEENGVYSIGYNSVKKQHSSKFLTAVVFEWEPLYDGILTDFIKGNTNNPAGYWWGAQHNVVSLSPYSEEVPKELIPVIDENMEKFRNGWDVYLGEIYRNDGVKMCEENERISDDALLFRMDWFVEGVEVLEE
jgi:basic membrane protein A